ncbi:unannotated protein [freshwater metagenome]|jgi:hypothetical protein|uniref:Unannotated protein n=1 Tax=freshwater metagenome TaxID=449393 RepID=A0A6J6D6C7_9ZZZZ|nr:DUF2304 family protein [Actinomycetota bacterium]
MSTLQYVLGIVAASLTLILVIEMLRLRRLRERHAIWWIVAGLGALVIAIFPEALAWVADKIGFEVPINLAFFASLVLLFLVALQHSAELTKVEAHSRTLAEQVALLDIRVRELEAKAKPTSATRVRDVKNAQKNSGKR